MVLTPFVTPLITPLITPYDGYILSKPAWSGLEEPGYQVGISGEVFSVPGGYENIAFSVKKSRILAGTFMVAMNCDMYYNISYSGLLRIQTSSCVNKSL